MTALADLARRASALALSVRPEPGIAVGSENERTMQRSEALASVARRVMAGMSPADAGAASKRAIRDIIKRHNARRPTCPNWGVDSGAYDALIDEAVAGLAG